MEIKFLNVDLEILSSENLQPIIDDFGENVSVLYHGENADGFNLAAFEVRWNDDDADAIISKFCFLIENFSLESKSVWEKCFSKRFDMGFESGDLPTSYRTEICSDTIERIAKLGASVVITIYPKGN